MLNNKNIVRKKLQTDDGKESTFDVYLQEGPGVEQTGKFKRRKDMNFAQKSDLVYKQATRTVDKLYKDPESLQNYKDAQESVRGLVQLVLEDDFAMKSLMSIATHDYYTHTHSLNVAIYTLSLGAYLKLDEQALNDLGHAGFLHDLGKRKIDVGIINKKGKLDTKEFKIMQAHSELGYKIAIKMGIKNEDILSGIRYHHEKMDGTGYPHGLKEKDIPFFARIVGLRDIFDALTSKRSYKNAMSTFDAFLLIKTKMNHHVDMKLLTV